MMPLNTKSLLKREFIVEGEIKMRLLVTPKDPKDFNRYNVRFRAGGFNDETAIKYCSNNNYIVRALWTDGINVIHKTV